MDSDNIIVDNKYNIEATEILANEAQVYTLLIFDEGFLNFT